MYLKALEIQGFKSFPEKTRLTFEKDITAIVGPNGSGKSNISDAILWVMGEQSTKTLRGGKMEDVIFGGTEKRNAMGFAQVSLILDNSGGLLAVDSSEVMITRRFYRSGESEYYINRESVRLRDINELLMDTGLGRDGYSIIGQGHIADIVSARNEDRRDIFEEAAGISRYRYRKEESERKLKKTDENLIRIKDKIDELELQVGPLKKQAETARRYLVLRDELRSIEVSLWMENLDRLRDKSELLRADYDKVRAELESGRAELEGIYADTENLSAKMREKDVEAEASRDALGAAEAGAAECDSAIAVLKAGVRHNLENLDRIRAELSEQNALSANLDAQITEQRSRIEEIDAGRSDLMRRIGETLRRAEETAADTGEAAAKVAGLLAQENSENEALAQGRTALSMLSDALQEHKNRESAIELERSAAEKRRGTLISELAAAGKAHDLKKAELAELNNAVSGHKLKMGGREDKLRELEDRHTRITIEARAMDSRIGMLKEMERDYDGFGKAVKTVMREAGRGTLRGIHGPVANLVKADDRFTLAIETALGASMQHVVVDSQEDGKAAINLLKRSDGGRGTFLPISTVRGTPPRQIPAGEDGFLGLASELARFDKKYSGIIENLLGRTMVVESLNDAVRISKRYDNRLRIVSLDGQLINAGGSMTGGSAASGAGMISRANELKRLTEARRKLETETAAVDAALSEARRELTAAKYEIETSAAQAQAALAEAHAAEAEVARLKMLVETADQELGGLDDEKASAGRKLAENREKTESALAACEAAQKRLESIRAELALCTQGREELERKKDGFAAELSELRASVASLDAERAATAGAMAQMEELRAHISGDGDSFRNEVSELERRNKDMEEELVLKEERLKEFKERALSLKSGIADINGFKIELEGLRARREKEAQAKNRELLDSERLVSSLEQKLLTAELDEKQIIDKLWDNYELSRSAAAQQRRPLESASKAAKRAGEIRREISSLGTPNLGAIEEYDRVSARYDFLTEQLRDIEKSKRELQKIISGIVSEMKEIFIREFKAIDESFRTTFLELFGGGRAALALEDEENVLDCGIEIKVQPPGKALSKLSLLSGGEMAFVAIALYLAILKVRPTPFCVMDEIESALDEVNVTRCADYIRKLSGKTQFVVITHRRGIMEGADMLYGITMEEKGVSKVIDLDLEQAEKTIA